MLCWHWSQFGGHFWGVFYLDTGAKTYLGGTLSPQEDNSHQESILPVIHNTLTSKPSCMYFRVNPSVNVTEIMFPWITSADVKAQYILCLLLPGPHYDLEAHSCFNTALLVQTTKAQPSQRGMELVFPTALHWLCGCSAQTLQSFEICDEKKLILKFWFVCIVAAHLRQTADP